MNLDYPAEAEEYRRQIRSFLRTALPEGWAGIGALESAEYRDFLASWRKKLFEEGLLAPAWPVEYGGAGLTPVERVVLAEEFARAGVPNGIPNDEFGIDMLGNTLLEFGTTEQRDYFLPRVLSGDHVWCQGFSEPAAGSDLANVRTRAELKDGKWVLNGQKIWTSDGMAANWIFVLARTDPEAPKHKGVSFFLVPIEQDGVELRPIRMMTGHREFCETFFDGAQTNRDNVVGGLGGGWAVALHLLNHERGENSIALPIRFKADLERLIDLARERRALDDPEVRSRLAWCEARVEEMRWLGLRSVSRWLKGEALGPETSIFKLCWSNYHIEETKLAMDILGESGVVGEGRRPINPYYCDEPGAPNSTASWQGSYLIAPGGTIYGGTSEIQRNILAQRVLGLPRS